MPPESIYWKKKMQTATTTTTTTQGWGQRPPLKYCFNQHGNAVMYTVVSAWFIRAVHGAVQAKRFRNPYRNCTLTTPMHIYFGPRRTQLLTIAYKAIQNNWITYCWLLIYVLRLRRTDIRRLNKHINTHDHSVSNRAATWIGPQSDPFELCVFFFKRFEFELLIWMK